MSLETKSELTEQSRLILAGFECDESLYQKLIILTTFHYFKSQ